MAPLEQLGDMVKRYLTCPSGYYLSGGYCYRYSSWTWWGRWVFAAVVIVFILGLLLILGCVNARRRRRQGLPPRYGTGWMARGNAYNNNNPNNYNNNYYQPPPPKYQAAAPVQGQYTGSTFNQADGYYGNYGNQEGIQLQQPSNAYHQRGGEPVYEPPAGPPPGKHN